MSEIFPEGTLTGIANITSYAIMVMDILTWMLFIILQFLLDPHFIFNLGESNAFLDMLNRIWVLSRDLMNIAFAVTLIGAAIYVVVKADKGEVSQYAPKFILSVVLVNFSWFAPLLIIDVANITASTIYGIPSMLMTGPAGQCKFPSSEALPGYTCSLAGPYMPPRFLCNCKVVTNAEFLIENEAYFQTLDKDSASGWKCWGPLLCVQMRDLDATTISGHSATLNGLIVNHARLLQLATVPSGGGAADPKALMTFVMRELIILGIHIALLFPLFAMVVAFAIRIPILWLTIAFMPFVFLKFVYQNQYTDEIYQKIWSNFLKAAFLPALLAIPLAVGFILVNAGASLVMPSGPASLEKIAIKLFDGIGSFWELVWLGMTLGVLWVGVFEMLGKMGPMAFGSAAIKGMGETLGKIALKAPLSLPVFPSIGGKSILGLPTMLRGIEGQLSQGTNLKKLLEEKPETHLKEGKYADAGRAVSADPELQAKLNDNIKHLTDAIKSKNESAQKDAISNINMAIDGKIKLPVELNEKNAVEQLKNISQYAGNTIAEKVKELDQAHAVAHPPAPANGTTTP